jgi:tetrahydromethanopterin S-methyltransferase subunit C
MANNTSQHILSTAGNLLGFCLVVITSLHISNQIENHLIDELTAVVAILLTLSCIFSFGSIRTSSEKKEKQFETSADYLFIAALVGILIIILLITLNFLS